MSSTRTDGDQHESLIRDMVEGISEGCVVPFFGAGVNCCGRPSDFTWSPRSEYLPAGAELARHLAALTDYPSDERGERENLLRVSQYMSTKKGYGRLRDELHQLLAREYKPTAAHRFFARLPKLMHQKGYGQDIQGYQLLMVTTNYDDLLERAFLDEGVEFDLLIYRTELNRGWFWHIAPDGTAVRIEKSNEYAALSLDVRPVIVKIHGAVDRANRATDSYVITEDDYIDYLAGADLSNFLPMVIKQELLNSHFLFLGYSLQDWNLRVFLKKIWEDQQKYHYHSWAVQLRPHQIDQELWRSRSVDIIDMSLDDYVVALQRQVDALPTLKRVDG